MFSYLPSPAEWPRLPDRREESAEAAEPNGVAEMQLPPRLWVHPFAELSDECPRYALQAIQFDFKLGHVTATDGRFAIRVRCDLSAFSGRAPVLLAADTLRRALELRTAASDSLYLAARGDRYFLELRSGPAGVVASFPWPVVEGRYPDFDGCRNFIFGDAPEGSRDIYLRANLLRTVAEYFDQCNIEEPSPAAVLVRVPMAGRAPVAFLAEGADVRLMGMADPDGEA